MWTDGTLHVPRRVVSAGGQKSRRPRLVGVREEMTHTGCFK
jgi:hypothetical protein